MEPKYPGCVVQLTGTDGNAFAIMGKVQGKLKSHMRGLEYSATQIKAEVQAYLDESRAGDYDHLLATASRWVEVQ